MSPALNKTINALCVWIDATPLSQWMQVTTWVVPTVQTVHILAIAVIASSAFMIDLRLIGLFWADRPMKAVSSRFLPLVWWPLLILFVTGLFQFLQRRNAKFGDLRKGPRAAAISVAIVSMLLWASIVFAGRWIAYYA